MPRAFSLEDIPEKMVKMRQENSSKNPLLSQAGFKL